MSFALSKMILLGLCFFAFGCRGSVESLHDSGAGDTNELADSGEAGDFTNEPGEAEFEQDSGAATEQDGCAGDDCQSCTPDCSAKNCGPDNCGGSCGECPAPQTCSLSGQCAAWRRGNTHTHSNLSDGKNEPAAVAQAYIQLGYDFLFLTDHSKWSDFSQFSTAQFVGMCGEEMNNANGHMNALGISAVLSAAALSRAEMIDSVTNAGGIPIWNHPAWTSLPLTLNDLWPLDRLRLMEIHNHITDKGFEEPMWDGMLTGGRAILGVAADDCHDIATGAGYGWIVARTVDLEASRILQTISAGDFYSSTGVALVDLQVTSSSLRVVSSNGEYIEFIGQGGKVLSATASAAAEYAFDGPERYVRARITGPGGKAWTQPVLLPGFSNDPYADLVVDGGGLSPLAQSRLIGPIHPGRIPSNWDSFAARISAGQSVVLDMGEGEEIVDGPGVDLYVEEVDAEDGVGGPDPYNILVSSDRSVWSSLGAGVGDGYFDLATSGLARARYMKIEVVTGDAEIDGVMYLDPTMRDPHADTVVEATGVTAGVAGNALGPPFPGQVPSAWQYYAVRIQAGGQLILDMGPGEEIVDHEGFDLKVEEVDTEDGVGGPDPYSVYASQDGATWILLGDGSGDTSFDLATAQLPKARFIKITVATGDAEIDAVSAL